MISVAFAAVRGVVADEVILKSGERFISSKVWEEDGKILFDMQGLIVNVNKGEVAAVVHGTHPAEPLAALPGQSVPGRRNPSSPALDPLPAEKPVLPGLPASPVDGGQNREPKIRGIGLDGLTWQMHPNEINGIAKLGTDPSYGGIDQYNRPGGSLTLGDAQLDGLVFGFWQNRLYTILIWVEGKPSYTRLRRAVFERYGSGRRSEQGLDRYIWIEDATDRMLEFDQQRNAGIFWMRSRELDTQIKRLYPGNE
jgi:hypothetical protein